MTNLQKDRIVYLRGKGVSYSKISSDLGVSENTVKSFCRRNKLGANHNPKPQSHEQSNRCPNCGGQLNHTTGAKRKRFCSDKCRMAWWAKHPEAIARKAVYRFTCPFCGAEFESYGNARRRFCSRRCSGAARRAAHD